MPTLLVTQLQCDHVKAVISQTHFARFLLCLRAYWK